MTTPTEISFKLLHVKTANDCKQLECAICYKGINKAYFICSEPCNKVFHMGCLDEAFKNVAETAYYNDEEAVQRCCYCRRHVNFDNYELETLAHELRTIQYSKCYQVEDALALIKHNIEHNIIFDQDDEYVVYGPKYMPQKKQPKEPKFKKTQLSRRLTNVRVARVGGMRRKF
jgi:hypothetical protein